jgi:hypothetical protein
MRQFNLRSRILLILFSATVVSSSCAGWLWYRYQFSHRLSGPNAVYWAWERPEDLRFLRPQDEAVAFLASSVELLPDKVKVQPRMQPLQISPGTQLVAVVRIYSHLSTPASLDADQLRQTAETALAATALPRVSSLQIDFDARSSERSFYSQLLSELRRRLGPSYPLSITALASWCIGDRWIRDLPVNEAVPMLFDLGSDATDVRQYLAAHSSFPEPLCRGSVGLSTNEWMPKQIHWRTRVYVFSPNAWTPASVDSIRSRLSLHY